MLNKKGTKVGMIRPITLNPLTHKPVALPQKPKVAPPKKVVV